VYIENITDLNPTAGYQLRDVDFGLFAVDYYGYVNSEGQWYIEHYEDSAYTFAKGDSDYDDHWANKAALAFARWDVVF